MAWRHLSDIHSPPGSKMVFWPGRGGRGDYPYGYSSRDAESILKERYVGDEITKNISNR
jgi:hypothetical protein